MYVRHSAINAFREANGSLTFDSEECAGVYQNQKKALITDFDTDDGIDTETVRQR